MAGKTGENLVAIMQEGKFVKSNLDGVKTERPCAFCRGLE